MRLAKPLGLVAFLVGPALAAFAADPPDERAKLQGVWHSPADAKLRARVIFVGDKAGFSLGNHDAKTPAPGSSFVAVSETKLGEEGGKKFAEIIVAKDYKKKVEYRFDKESLVVRIDDKEYPLARVNTRADDAAAKKFAGTWTVTGAEAQGMKLGAKEAGLESVSFTGDRFVWKAAGGKEILSSLYRIGELKDGRGELDIFGLKADPIFPALVELKGDELVIAQPTKAGGARPTDFDTAKGDVLVIRATRAKK
jgi:uncharacterized protein (TIGR03067 family)